MHHAGAEVYLFHPLSLTMIPHQMCEVGHYTRPVLKTSPLGVRAVLLGTDFKSSNFMKYDHTKAMAIVKQFSLRNGLCSTNKTGKES